MPPLKSPKTLSDSKVIKIIVNYLAKNDSMEGLVKLHRDLHVPLTTHDLQVNNVGHVFGPFTLPKF